jgi:spore germination protein YaaH
MHGSHSKKQSSASKKLLLYVLVIAFVATLIATYPYKINSSQKSQTARLTGQNDSQNVVTNTIDNALNSTNNSSTTTNATLERLFYYAPRYNTNAIQSIKENIGKIDILAPQTYVINDKLIATGTVSDEIKQAVAGSKIKIMPLIANDHFDQYLIHRFLASDSAQTAAIDFLIKEAKNNGYIGWQFDIEHIRYVDRNTYSQFVERAEKEFLANNLKLSVAVVVRTDDKKTDFYKDWSGAFDYVRLASSTDFISVMTYDDPEKLGPVAPMPFVTSAYEYLKDKIPANKFSLGVPLYYWGWNVATQTKMKTEGTYEDLMNIKSNYSYTEGTNKNYGVPYVLYTNQGKKYIIWHEDDTSLKLKLDFARSKNLRGFSAWVLGVEDPKIWSAI